MTKKATQVTIIDMIKNPGLVPNYTPSKIGKNKKWTERELNYLRDNWGKKTKKEIAAKLKRSVESVRFQGNVRMQLNLRPIKRWTKTEEDFIKENYLESTYSEMGEVLGRSHGSIAVKATHLGLKKQDSPKYWNKAQDKILKRMKKEDYPTNVISHVLGRSEQAISNRLRKLEI